MSARRENACKNCGWHGTTVADRWALWLLALLFAIALALVVANRLELGELARVLTWPVTIVLAALGLLIPFLLPRVRRCPECRGRDLEIVSRKVDAG